MSNFSTQNTSQHGAAPTHASTTQQAQLTRRTLAHVAGGQSNVQMYLSRDQNFERVPLGLQTAKTNGGDAIVIWEQRWERARRN